jgi:uncharacterized alkaline shock family protein YloU
MSFQAERSKTSFGAVLGARVTSKVPPGTAAPAKLREESMGEESTTLGGIHISPHAVATIAHQAVLESYGVVGLAPMNLADGIVKSITREPSKGVAVLYNGEDIDIEVHIIVEYGTRINSVAESVKNTIRFHVEKALGLKVNSVNVHVAGLRISNTD